MYTDIYTPVCVNVKGKGQHWCTIHFMKQGPLLKLKLAELVWLTARELWGPPLSRSLCFPFSIRVTDSHTVSNFSMAARNPKSWLPAWAANTVPTGPSPHYLGNLFIDSFNRYLMSFVLTMALTTTNETSLPLQRFPTYVRKNLKLKRIYHLAHDIYLALKPYSPWIPTFNQSIDY